MPSWSRSSRIRCSGVRPGRVEEGQVAGVKAVDDEPADVVEERGDRELVAIREADRAADHVGGVLGGEGVDPEPLRAQVAATVDLEEVEDSGRPGDRQHPGRLEDFDRLDDARGATRRRAAAIRRTEDGDRQGDVGLDRFDQVAGPRGLRGRGLHDPRLGLGQDREALYGLECGCQACAGRGLRSLVAHGVLLGLSVALLLGGRHGRIGSALPSAATHIWFSKISPKVRTFQRNRAKAAEIRSRERFLPSSARDSNMPGETVAPVIATLIGW